MQDMCARLLTVTWKIARVSSRHLAMLTYLVASFMGLLHKHPPLVVQLHGHAAAAVGVLPYPAKELLQLSTQRGVGVSARLGVAGARHQPLCRGGTIIFNKGRTKMFSV